jgi:acyl-coenzyme A thioesterase PaaI-like protein
MYKYFTPKIVKRALNIWPPFWGAGISIQTIAPNFQEVRVILKDRFWNRNANRSQYGGSIFSMTDPVFSLMLMGILREEYFVWDKQSEIDFISPGTSDLSAQFLISDEKIQEIKRLTEAGEKCFPKFEVYIYDKKGKVVARVNRTLYVRKKPEFR